MRRRLFHPPGLALLVAAVPACSVLEDYPEATAGAFAAFRNGRFEEAARLYREREGALESDRFLSLAEAGTAWHAAGRLRRASKLWLEALEVAQGFRDRPTISGRGAVEGTLSMLLNDKTLPYDGEGFEIVLLHGLLAWDYLRLGRLDDAMVEVWRGYDAQKLEEERYGTTYGMNRFARFVAAVVQEQDGALDDAALDLRQLRRELPGHPAVEASLERIRTLRGPEARDLLSRSELILVFEQETMPPKTSEDLVFGYGKTLVRITAPSYRRGPGPVRRLRLQVDDREAGATELIEDVYAVARENLEDRVAWAVAKSAGRNLGRAVLIDRLGEEAGERHGDWAEFAVRLAGNLLNLALEQADLRSWRTLPANLQVLRVPVEAGRHSLDLELEGGGRLRYESVGFPAGRPVLLSVRSLRGRLYAHLSGAEELPDPTTTEAEFQP